MFKKKKPRFALDLRSSSYQEYQQNSNNHSSSSSRSSPLSSLRAVFSPRKEKTRSSTKRISIDFEMFSGFVVQFLQREDDEGLAELLNNLCLDEETIENALLEDYIFEIRKLAYLQYNIDLEKALQDFEKNITLKPNRKKDNELWSLIRDSDQHLKQSSEFVALHRERMFRLYLSSLV